MMKRIFSATMRFLEPLVAFPAAAFAAATWLFLIDRTLATTWRFGTPLASLSENSLIFAAHAVAVLALGVPAALVFACHRRFQKRWLPIAVAGIAFAAIGFWLGRVLASGDFIKQLAWAGFVRFGVPAALALAGALVATLLTSPRTRAPMLGLVGATSVGASLADARVLPDLYPEAHLVLYLVAALFAAFVFFALAVRVRNRRWQLNEALLSGAALLLSLPLWFGMSSEQRALASLASPATARIVEWASPRITGNYLRHEIDSDFEGEPFGHAIPSQNWLPEAKDWNVILLINDALRADVLPPARAANQESAKAGDTPFLDGWLEGTYRFTRAYSQASRTKRSMPPLFQSTEPSGDTRGGLPLPRLMAGLGKVPIAVVPQYFLMPFEADAQHLLEGFDHVEFFEKDRQDTLVKQARELLSSVRDRPFFAWIHFYNLHDPYYAGHLQSPEDGSAPERYRRAVKWLDTEQRELMKVLAELGLLERTLVIFTADHGESLGEHGRRGHGSSVWDEQTRVPLAIRIPGKPGGLIDRVVGNIDIVPTILDLLGRSPLPEHRGRSLVPLLKDPDTPWKFPYYMLNGSERVHGLVHGQQKLVFDQNTGNFYRFDLEQRPKEERSLFRRGSVVDTWLLRELIRRNPGVVAHELETDPLVPERLTAQLDALNGEQLTERVEFLVATAALVKTKSVTEAAERLFARARDPDLKLAIVYHLFKTDRKRWDPLLGSWLEAQSGELAQRIAGALARRAQPVFSTELIRKRLSALAQEAAVGWEPWLSLVLPWKKSPQDWGRPFGALVEAAANAAPPAEVLRLLLENVGSLTGADRELGQAVERYTNHASALVAAAAVSAVARHKAPNASEVLRTLVRQPGLDVRIRQAVMQGLARLEGEQAVPLVIELGHDRLLTVDAIKILGRIKSREGLPYLEDIVEHHYNSYTVKQARQAIKAIRGFGKGKGSSKKEKPSAEEAPPNPAPDPAAGE